MPTPMFIAEVSSNHARDFKRCVTFIETAAAIGCDAVKFQLFKIDALFAPEILSRSPEHRRRREWELPESFIPDIAACCQNHGVAFWCTPFYLEAVDLLAGHVQALKVASYELLWTDLLRRCAATGKPVVLSTGMADLEEVGRAVAALRDAGCDDLSLLHCVSGYPAPAQQANLAAIATLREAFGCPAGWSDHTVVEGVVHRAVHRFGASLVEFHLDLDAAGAEYAAGHCWLPRQAEAMIRAVRLGCLADGDGVKAPVAAEAADRQWRADPVDGLRPLPCVRRLWT